MLHEKTTRRIGTHDGHSGRPQTPLIQFNNNTYRNGTFL